MNVAVVELASGPGMSSEVAQSCGAAAGPVSEWIDPEGDDWFADIYRELTDGPVACVAAAAGSAVLAGRLRPEVEHWFG